VKWTKIILTSIALMLVLAISWLAMILGQIGLADAVAGALLLAVMILAAVKFASLTLRQVLVVMLFSVAFCLFIMHFALGVAWMDVPEHLHETIHQFRSNAQPLMACVS
jgi:hypothetical protein